MSVVDLRPDDCLSYQQTVEYLREVHGEAAVNLLRRCMSASGDTPLAWDVRHELWQEVELRKTLAELAEDAPARADVLEMSGMTEGGFWSMWQERYLESDETR